MLKRKDSASFVSTTDEGTYPGVGALLSRDLAHLIDLGELCLPREKSPGPWLVPSEISRF